MKTQNLKRNILRILITFSITLSTVVAHAEDSSLIFWYTNIPSDSPHHSNSCGFYNLPALVVQENKSPIDALTSLRYYWGEKSWCGTFKKYQIEKRYGPLTLLGKKITCPIEICKPGSNDILDTLQVHTIPNVDRGISENEVVEVTFYDQGYMGVNFYTETEEYKSLVIYKFDTKNPKAYIQQMKKILSFSN